MPIYEYRCDNCGEVSEVLVLGKEESRACRDCGSADLTKLMSAHNTIIRSSSAPHGRLLVLRLPNACGAPGMCCAPEVAAPADNTTMPYRSTGGACRNDPYHDGEGARRSAPRPPQTRPRADLARRVQRLLPSSTTATPSPTPTPTRRSTYYSLRKTCQDFGWIFFPWMSYASIGTWEFGGEVENAERRIRPGADGNPLSHRERRGRLQPEVAGTGLRLLSHRKEIRRARATGAARQRALERAHLEPGRPTALPASSWDSRSSSNGSSRNRIWPIS